MSTAAPLCLVSFSMVIALALPLLSGGCSTSRGDAATEAALLAAAGHDVRIDHSDDRANVGTDDGGMRVAAHDDIALPADFPVDVYLPANHHVRSVMDIDDARLVSVTVSGSPAMLQDEASVAMRARGWKPVMVMAHEQARMLSFQKDRRAATMTLLAAEDGRVQFNVQLTARSP